jgi:hypothetical protein
VVIRYRNSPDGSEYLFRYNDNFPAFILMSIIVSLFMGLTISAEEIIRDRKMLKRESFLNLSWNSYLMSKLAILFSVSAIQSLLFVIVGHSILEIRGMLPAYWLILFSTSCFANILGLNISSAFNSAVTVYIIIPLLLIPQMILSGTLFSFDKLNDLISTRGRTPLVADAIASRWGYEALAVYSFRENEYQRHFFKYEKQKSTADFNAAYLANALESRANEIIQNLNTPGNYSRNAIRQNLSLLAGALKSDYVVSKLQKIDSGMTLSTSDVEKLPNVIDEFRKSNQDIYNKHLNMQEKTMSFFQQHGWDVDWNKDRYFNQSLSDLVRNVNTVDRIVEHDGKLIQLIDPVFQSPNPAHALDYRAPFFASEKHFLGIRIDTFWFNTVVIWAMCALLYAMLYTLSLQKLIRYFEALTLVSLKRPNTLKIQKQSK